MCDYSLHAFRNRLAREGELLVVHRFETGTIGLTSDSVELTVPETGFWKTLLGLGRSAKPPCAVCVPPGAELLLRKIPVRVQQQFGVSSTEEVKFTQTGARENVYRDAVRFKNGIPVLLQFLQPGQPVRVLRLSPVEEILPEVSGTLAA